MPATDLVETDTSTSCGRSSGPDRGGRQHRARRQRADDLRRAQVRARASARRATTASSARSGSFSRSLRLPEGVDAEAITANFDNGVLEVRIPKPEQRSRSKVAIIVSVRRKTIEGGEDTDPPARPVAVPRARDLKPRASLLSPSRVRAVFTVRTRAPGSSRPHRALCTSPTARCDAGVRAARDQGRGQDARAARRRGARLRDGPRQHLPPASSRRVPS